MADDRLGRIAEVVHDVVYGETGGHIDGDESDYMEVLAAAARTILHIANGGERVEGRVQWGDPAFGFLDWEPRTQMPKAYDGPATLILHPRDTEGAS